MNETQGDLWEFHADGNVVAIPTNIGWNRRGDGIMGRGVAHQAALRFPIILQRWGAACRQYKANTPVFGLGNNLLAFPTKPLNEVEPWMSWDQLSSIPLITRSLEELRTYSVLTPVYLPLPGAGNGRLPKEQVLALVREKLDGTRHVLVHRQLSSKANVD